jgi:hypothetical protein
LCDHCYDHFLCDFDQFLAKNETLWKTNL